MSLPINFHRTFIPERRLLNSLLQYAGNGLSGSYHDIAGATGIPMGKSNGKVPAIIDYARGMGLIQYDLKSKNGIRHPVLTNFGRIVLLEDALLSQPVTQWIAHLSLCHPSHGAAAWYETFVRGRDILGASFTVTKLEDYLKNVFGPGRNRIGPLIRTYHDDVALGKIDPLKKLKKQVISGKAPIAKNYARVYAAYILQIIEDEFPGQIQVTAYDLNSVSGMFDAASWVQSDTDTILNLIEETNSVRIDRQMRPWIIHKLQPSSEVWSQIYK